MTARKYASPAAFKEALEQRLRAGTSIGAEFARRRQKVVFARFLARAATVFGGSMLLKGGLVLELRIDRARATKDVDLRVTGSAEQVLATLQRAMRLDLGDYLTFEIGPDPHHPAIQNDGMPYAGLRFRAECRLAGHLFGQPFGVDVGFGDPVFGEPEVVLVEDMLAFAGIAPPSIRLYPLESHIAEKLHAYTLPRARPNSRVKDLPDIALLASVRPIAAGALRDALRLTFDFRASHPLPILFPDPLPAWEAPYAALARQDRLAWKSLEEVTLAARAFLDPVLSGGSSAAWQPEGWRWLCV